MTGKLFFDSETSYLKSRAYRRLCEDLLAAYVESTAEMTTKQFTKAIEFYLQNHDDVAVGDARQVTEKLHEAVEEGRGILLDEKFAYIPNELFRKICTPLSMAVSLPKLKQRLVDENTLRPGTKDFVSKKNIVMENGISERIWMLWFFRARLRFKNDMVAEVRSSEAEAENEAHSMSQILEMQFGGEPQILEGILGSGVYILAGSPKIGKSFLCLQLAYHIARGQPLWGRKTQKGDVLYFGLEDNAQRIQNRFRKMFGDADPKGLYVQTTVSDHTQGITGAIEKFFKRHENLKLVILDTLQKVTKDANSYSAVYDFTSKLKDLCDAYQICVLLVHHVRKSKAKGDPFTEITGSAGIFGAADGAWLLKRERSTTTAELSVTGRDVSDQNISLRFDGENCQWEEND